jgi:uncharacterized membrane protein YedE/YeeE
MNIRQTAIAFLSGLLFAVGLGIGGMTDPANIIGFLDFTGKWNPLLLFVMGGAVPVFSIFYIIVRKRSVPMFAKEVLYPTKKDIDARLIAGSAIFGAGWGLAGFCPGPALTSLSTGNTSILIFGAAMTGGVVLFRAFQALVLEPTVVAKPESAK